MSRCSTMNNIDIDSVSTAMDAIQLTNGANQPSSTPFTFASIGTVLLDMFESESSTPAPFSPYISNALSPASSSSSLSDYDLVTPEDIGRAVPLPTLSRPPSVDSLASLSSLSFAKPSAALGGGGLYALIGARVWLPSSEMRTVIDRAPRGQSLADIWFSGADIRPSSEFPLKDDDDIPSALEAEMEQFGPEMWVYHQAPGLCFPRARIGYDGDVRRYQHIVKPSIRTGEELANGPLAGATYLHVAPPYGPSDLLQLLSELKAAGSQWVPKIVFEPVPSSCHPGEKDNFERTAQLVDVLTPNHEELFGFYGIATSDSRCEIRAVVEHVMRHLLLTVGVGADGNGIVVIRCGPHGACVGTRAGGLKWTPAYYCQDSLRVKDVTGAGNAFVGGYIAGLKLTGGNPYDAALYAGVSASFVVEQFGLPRLTGTPVPSPVVSAAHLCGFPPAAYDYSLPLAVQNANRAGFLRAAAGRELWNSDAPQRRLELLRLRTAASS